VASATVVVSVVAVAQNHPPVAIDDSAETSGDTSIVIAALSNVRIR